jgi:hypothetical protein
MSKLARFEIALLALAACVLSTWAASQSSTPIWYVGALAFALISIGALRFPTMTQLVGHSSARVQVWWPPAVLSLGVLLLVGVLVARFILVPAA